MECKDVRNEINRVFDCGEIKDKTILAHIKNCKNCLKEYNAVLKIKNALFTKDKIKLTDNFNNMVWNKIGEPRPAFFNFSFILRPVFATAVAFILILFGAIIFKNNHLDIEKQNLVYNINNKKNTESKKFTPVDKQIDENQEIKTDKIVRETKEENTLISAEVKQANKEIENKDKEIVYNTFIPPQEDIKPGNITSKKISVAEVKKEPDKIETTDIRYLREDFTIINNIINPLKSENVVIRYKIQKQYPVKIVIYDRNGEVVKKLVNENKDPGVYEVKWDGKDEKEILVAAGIYFIYLKTDLVEKKLKVLVVK